MSELEIEKRIERADGKRALLIFVRPDGLFVYREDSIYEDEETYPHWREGYPSSGLFSTAQDAEADARRSIDWLRISN